MKITIDREFALTTAISPKAKNLYLILLTYAHDQASCFPSIDKLSTDLDGSEKTTRRALLELKEIGLIKVYRDTTKLKGNNNYIIMPTEWVDYETKYTADTYNISKEEYEASKLKIINFYEEQGIKDLHPELVESTEGDKPKDTPKTTLEARYNEVKAKAAKNSNYKYNASDCLVIYAKILKDKKGQVCKFNSTNNKTVFKDRLVGLDNEDIELFINTYIDMYDSTFRTDKYPAPTVKSLAQDWLFNSVLVKAQAIKDMTAKENTELKLSGVVF